MSLGSWPEAVASDSRAVTTAVRNRVRKNMKRSVLDDAWPLILLPIFRPPQPDGSGDPLLLYTFHSFTKTGFWETCPFLAPYCSKLRKPDFSGPSKNYVSRAFKL